jgi:hypothetical protein
MSKARTELVESIFELVAKKLIEALEYGTTKWPLPGPPVQDPDFPALHPASPHDLFSLGLGILNLDRGMFERHLINVVERLVPYRMNLTDDPFEVHNTWLKKRQEDVADRLMFHIATDWLAEAFDKYAPNSGKWWLSVALIDGLCTKPHGSAVHEGYHLLESIALAERPGTWHTQPDVGPQHMEWNPNAVVPRMTDVVAHEEGVKAALWILERLESDNAERRLLLMEWVRLLLERQPLVGPLDLPNILLRRSADSNVEVVSKVILCLAKTIEFDPELGLELAERLHQRDEILIQRGMADVLTRMFRRLGWKAHPYLQDMLKSNDEGVLAAASSTVGDLKYLDKDTWADTIQSLASHPTPIVRRNLVSNLRDYIEFDPEDRRNIVPILWMDGDEVVRTRLRELLLRMEEIAPHHFAQKVQQLTKLNADLNPLWEPLEMRKPGGKDMWLKWLKDGGDMQHHQQKSTHVSSMEAPEELPKLDSALEVLDQDLGFLDD